jgi:hypothetical protein
MDSRRQAPGPQGRVHELRTRIFWILVTVLDAIAAGALVLCFRKFGEDTAAARSA